MNKYNHLLRTACTVIAAALMAGCSAYLAARTPGFALPWTAVYGVALGAALTVELGRRGRIWAIAAGSVLVVSFAALLAAYYPELYAGVRAAMDPLIELDAAAGSAAGMGMALLLALGLGAAFALLLHAVSGAPFVLLVLIAAVICSLTLNREISVWAALPGLAAGVAAFGLPGVSHKDGVRPVLMAPALLLALLAFWIAPVENTTWGPLENLAESVRSVVEDYIRFTEERIAFSINEEGYDRAGMIGDDVVAMLGGPADPAEEPVMRVQADGELLLRGTIKRTYTGYSWVDDVPKARYLYYDFTHRGTRSDVFDAENTEDVAGFSLHSARVEMLSEGTSTLFVPAQLAGFDMSLADAVYYNSAGEIFLTREVQPGDSYAFLARTPDSREALISAVQQHQNDQDAAYERMLSEYTALPGGIDSRVYALAVELTGGTNNAAEKAYAIQDHLAKNYEYTLEGRYPEGNADFVSWFLLEEKQGYCSYFASAMAVMCRIAGMPARYIEGYHVPAHTGSEALVLTGRNAHAWVEVYLKGIGWVAFDATARSARAEGEAPGEDGYSQHGVEREGGQENPFDGQHPEEGPSPSPSPDIGSNPDPTPDPGDEGMNNPEETKDPGGEPSPSPTPEGGETPPDEGEDDGGDDGDDAPEPPPEGEDEQDDSTPPPPEGGDNSDNSDNSETPDDQDNQQNQNDQNDQNDSEDQQDEHSRVWLWVLLALILAALTVLAVLIVRRRLMDSDPLVLCASVRSGMLAGMILYRGILTLLAQMGLAPMNGETPQAFARRVTASLPNDAYERFVEDVVAARYSGRPFGRETIQDGREAYVVFLGSMRRGEKLRFCIRRILHGLGSFENIP